MSKELHSLMINGKLFSNDKLVEYASKMAESTNAEWEEELYRFILWYVNPAHKELEVNTSGSSGKPKTIKLSKDQLNTSAEITLQHLKLKKNDSALLAIPVKYIGGKMMVVRAFVGQLDLIPIQPQLDLFSSTDEKKTYEFCALTPTQIEHALNKVNALPQINKLIIGGAPVSHDLNNRLSKLKSNVFETYGMTETASHVALREIAPSAQKSFYPIGSHQIKIKDGCISVSAPALGINEIVTNDLGELRSDGSFIICGRVDNVINSGGVKINPELIEQELSNLIHDNFIVGFELDQSLGQKLVLVIESDPWKENRIKNLMSELKTAADNTIYPKVVRFFKEFPMLQSGKIDRNAIQALLLNSD